MTACEGESPGRLRRGATLLLLALAIGAAGALGQGPATPADHAPLAPLPAPGKPLDARQVELGRLLFHDGRLSGDASTSCASCHDPARQGTDGLALSKGYPGALYFRNTPTVVNAALGKSLYWDGRLSASDLPTLVRDHISEAHFMQADGRLVIERLRQVPQYEQGFKDACGGEPSYGRILNVVAAYVASLRSKDVPFDRHLAGDRAALSEGARRGLALFEGQAGCLRCHNGPMLQDGRFHNLGLPENADIFRTSERHIVLRRFLKTLGVPQYIQLRQDPGRYAVTKQEADRGRFRTPSLREVSRTAPYMHNGMLATLKDVVAFYNRGGSAGPGKDALLRPLKLSAGEMDDLVAFLESLAGAPIDTPPVQPPAYRPRKLGEN